MQWLINKYMSNYSYSEHYSIHFTNAISKIFSHYIQFRHFITASHSINKILGFLIPKTPWVLIRMCMVIKPVMTFISFDYQDIISLFNLLRLIYYEKKFINH